MSIFFFNDTATTEIYTLSLHDALPICETRHLGRGRPASRRVHTPSGPRKSGMPESVLMPAPVKATICSHSTIHRAIISICCSWCCSSVIALTVELLIVATIAHQAASLERMRCSVPGTKPNGRRDALPCRTHPYHYRAQE